MMLFAPRAAYDAGPFVTTHVRCVGRLMLTIASAAPKGLFSTIAPGVTVWIFSNTWIEQQHPLSAAASGPV
jgi:hypothetical protein